MNMDLKKSQQQSLQNKLTHCERLCRYAEAILQNQTHVKDAKQAIENQDKVRKEYSGLKQRLKQLEQTIEDQTKTVEKYINDLK